MLPQLLIESRRNPIGGRPAEKRELFDALKKRAFPDVLKAFLLTKSIFHHPPHDQRLPKLQQFFTRELYGHEVGQHMKVA